MYVTYVGRKTASCSQLDTVLISPVFHSCFLKGTNLFCKCHPPAVWYGTLNQVAQLISSGQVMLSLEFYFEVVVEHIYWKEVPSDTWSWKDWIAQKMKTISFVYFIYLW